MVGLLRTGGRVLVDALVANGVERVFCVPGESYLAALDAFYDTATIELFSARNEGGAAYMADAYGKLSGRPGICFVTRGPGALNASCGVHTAFQDSTPMVLLIGQVARGDIEREAFQEIDFRQIFGPITKWATQVDEPGRLPEFVNRAFAVASSGRPGPVALALPEDMLSEQTAVADLPAWQRLHTDVGQVDLASSADILASAKRPLAIVGGGGWSDAARVKLEQISSEWCLPVATAFRCQDYFDNGHSNYIGDLGVGVNPALVERVNQADVLLVLGARMGEMTTQGFSLLDVPKPQQRFVHIHAGAEELGRIYHPELAINATPARFVEAWASLDAPQVPVWEDFTRSARQGYLDWNRPNVVAGNLQLAQIVDWLAQRLPADAIICNGAGNYTGWVHRFYRFGRYRTQLAPTNGTMGYGVPAAVAAKLTHPDRIVVAFAGDGCFMMNGQELATAAQYGAEIIVIVVNNAMFGTIRMHQERRYPGRAVGTELVNPDFVGLAKGYGAHGELVQTTEQFEPAFERALGAGRSALIEIQLDPEIISTTSTLTGLTA